MSDLSVVNIVGGGSIHRELDLREVYDDFPCQNTEYDAEIFPALVIRYQNPTGTVMLYSSGKYSLAGSQSIEDAKRVNKQFISNLTEMLGEDITNSDFEIRYLVGTGNLGRELDLENVAIGLGLSRVEYEPEQFPGLIFRPKGKEWFCMLFGSGKVVFSGVSDEKQLNYAYYEIKERIEELFDDF